jgi:hypothetical protein
MNIMKIYKRFTVLEDGCLLDDFTGAILWPKEKESGEEYHFISDGKKNNFWLVESLLKLKEEHDGKRIQAA